MESESDSPLEHRLSGLLRRMEPHWQLQDAKQRFSELLRRARDDGPQFVTKHGKAVAVVVDITDFRELTDVHVEVDFKAALAEAGPLDDDAVQVLESVVAERSSSFPREIDPGELT